jgi:hypothetical protein
MSRHGFRAYPFLGILSVSGFDPFFSWQRTFAEVVPEKKEYCKLHSEMVELGNQ